jgi:hypothetical protein
MKRRTWRPLRPRTAIALLILLMAFVPAGCGFDFDMSCGGNENEIETYTDPGYGYSFQYPGDWEVEESTGPEVTSGAGSKAGVNVFDPNGASAKNSSGKKYYVDLFQVSVYELTTTVDESMRPEIKTEMEGLLADLGSQEGDWQMVEDLSETSVDGMFGYQTSYSFVMDGTPTMCTFYFVFEGNIQYQLTTQAATENWENEQTAFDAIVASFKPGPATTTTSATSQ